MVETLYHIWKLTSLFIGSHQFNTYKILHIFLFVARLLLPQIIQMYESAEGKKQLAEWKAEQEKQKEIVAAESKSEGR